MRRLLARLLPSRRPASTSVRRPAADRGDQLGYDPRPDGNPDPGEVVWAWVAYEDDPRQGKDRPVVVIGRRGDRLLGLMLTSKDHDRDAADEARYGRHWMDVGSGGWDRQRRPSEVRLDRLLVLEPAAVRREGAALDRAVFDSVINAALPFLG
ncbi:MULTISPECIES: type II toxin-antitoxin system PemK/MazF family toxin [unclassified Nocardioides]|uniref:type II toxin-antitoxin system PemK/MazF family toxin n=1 Tax=unclassified Nocardioides TaxID=2615069 RepID=UPI003014EAE0